MASVQIPAETDSGPAPRNRRLDYDVTNTVRVSSVNEVRDAVHALYDEIYPDGCFDPVWLAFHDFRRLFRGTMPGYQGCDTVYHDIQHTLDTTLAMARLIAGHERSVAREERLGHERAAMGLICALFHDAGYIRENSDQEHRNGAELTLCHIARGALYLQQYMAECGLGERARVAGEILHFTGYEKNLDDIELEDPRDSVTGYLLGTADLIAQMADRCYLEKCRDRLYPEFVLAGIAISADQQGLLHVRYQSGIDLLLQTPSFYRDVVLKRLNKTFNGAYRYIETLYNGRNPYLEFIERNVAYLEHIIETGEWPSLRRTPPCFTVMENPVNSANILVNRHLQQLRGMPAILGAA